MSNAIEIEDLTKTFTLRERAEGLRGALRSLWSAPSRTVTAVDGLSLRIEAGERVAFLGPNGAGKSTAIKLLTGILHPTRGRATVAGLVPWDDRRRLAHRIGTVFGQRSQLWYHLPASDTFELLGRVYDLPRAEHRRRCALLVETFGIGEHLHTPVRQLSLGQRMRCELVASLLHAPPILFLDEPTIGLDVEAKATIREVVRRDSERDGRTVLLTSHDTADVERVCDRIVVIHRGGLLLDEGIDALRTRFLRRKRVVLHTTEPELELCMAGVREVDRRPHRLEIEVDVDVAPVEAVVQAVLRRARLRDLSIEDPPMDAVIRVIYERAAQASLDERQGPVARGGPP
jgi:ABC-2 type transport system ATP-binding protein